MITIQKLVIILIAVLLPLLVSSGTTAAATDFATTALARPHTSLNTLGQLRVWQPAEAVQTTISLDGVARGDWGFWSDLPPGNYSLSLSEVPGWQQPAEVRVLIYANDSTVPEWDYMLQAPWIIPVYAGKFTEVRVEFTELVYQTHYQVIAQVHKTEEAGATSSEVSELTALLNQVVGLNEEAIKLSAPSDAQRRAELMGEANQLLTSVQTKANQLQAVASQRTLTSTLLAYVTGAVAAFLGTLAYAYGLRFWRRYRIKRTFEMKISPK